MKFYSVIFVWLFTSTCTVRSARILAIFPLPARSHYILGSTLMRALAEKGHDVTMVSPFSEKLPPKNGTYRNVVITVDFEKLHEKMQKQMSVDQPRTNIFKDAIFRVTAINNVIETNLKQENFQALINSNEIFDVVIVEQFINDAHKALATHFKAPLILFSSIGANFWINPLVGNPSPPSYIPDIFLEYSNQMTFWQRLTNSVFYTFNQLLYHFVTFPKQNEFIKKYIPNGPDLNDVLYNASLVLLNSHPSTNQAVPYVPNMIDIGGFHVKPPKKLPQDLQEFMDGAKEGVIYFSMGSNLKSSQLPPETRDALLKTFSKLKEKILWKWEEDVLPGQPSNVKLMKWLPQSDILAHPNLKLFITHGGLLSTTETIYHGVPILAIPIFGDQKTNARIAVNNGYGLSISFNEISEEKLTENINEILKNPKYADNAKKRSRLFHDRPVSPMDTAIYWIEYVIRHKGAPHLRVAALDLPWYKYHLLDVIGFVALSSLVAFFVLYLILNKICKVFCKNSKKVKTN